MTLSGVLGKHERVGLYVGIFVVVTYVQYLSMVWSLLPAKITAHSGTLYVQTLPCTVLKQRTENKVPNIAR